MPEDPSTAEDKDLRVIIASELVEMEDREFDHIGHEVERFEKALDAAAKKLHVEKGSATWLRLFIRIHQGIFDEAFYDRLRSLAGRACFGDDTKSALLRYCNSCAFSFLVHLGRDQSTGKEAFLDISVTNPVVRAELKSYLDSELGRLRHGEFDPYSKLGVARGAYRSPSRATQTETAKELR